MRTPVIEPVQLGRRRVALAIPLLALGLVAAPVLAKPATHQTTRILMGTRVDLTLQGATPRQMADASQAAFAEMTRLANMMSRYRSTSVLNAVNLMAGLRSVPVPPEMMAVLLMARQVHLRSGGGFDATVGALRGWNFDANHPLIPSAEEIADELRLVGQTPGLILDEGAGTAYLAKRGMRLDLGGIAKLPILQAGMQQLRAQGVHNAMINGGGDVLVNGLFNDRPWRVGLRDPRQPAQVLGVVSLTQGLVAASGDYERFVMRDGQRLHHILDPKTGYPTHGPRGVALISERLDAINGLGAAIMVAGADAGQAMLQRAAGVDALIVDADGSSWFSPGMKQRLS